MTLSPNYLSKGKKLQNRRKAKAISSRKEVLNLAKGSLETKTKEFVQLTEEVTNLLEKETGQIGD
ncbi:MAG TPA: hypothetical protein VK487_07095, partial [Candidatus Bathyarchaeia archaeon]|nr:hypothetical protein [Candidatus Bathyarchaeia archaeon]